MARKALKQSAEEPAEGSAEEASEQVWITSRECRLILGGISPQQWSRVLKEHTVPNKIDERGVPRYDADIIEALRDKLGFAVSEDPRDRAIAALHEENDSLRRYTKDVNEYALRIMNVLRDENDSVRKMRAEEQAQHLKALIATQEALDLSAEREIMRAQQAGDEQRKMFAFDWVFNKVGPKIMAQWEEGANTNKIVSLVRSLEPEQFDALKVLVKPDQLQALEALRNDGRPADHAESTTPDSPGS